MSKAEAIALLQDKPLKTFIVRDSNSFPAVTIVILSQFGLNPPTDGFYFVSDKT